MTHHPRSPRCSRLIFLPLLLALMGAAGGCNPASPPLTADELTMKAIAGLEMFSQNGCAACHCNDGVGGCNLNAPSLQRIQRTQLDDVLRGDQGRRPHPLKMPDASDEELDGLMLFLDSLAPGAELVGDSQITRGYNLYVQGGCIACHLASAQGVNQGGTGAPIAGTNPDNIYLALSGSVPCHPRQRDVPEAPAADCRFGIETNETVQALTDTPPPDVDDERVLLSYFLAFISPPPSGGKVEPCEGRSGDICTVAGTGVSGYTRDGIPATESLLYSPLELGLTDWNVDGVLDLAIIDWNNHRARLVYLDTTIDGVPNRIESIAGTGKVTGEDALNHPTDLAFDADGAMIMANWHNQNIYRYPRGARGAERHQLAGLCDLQCSDDGAGPTRVDATFLSLPSSVAIHPDARIFIAEAGCSRLRILTPGVQPVRSQPAQCTTAVNLYADGIVETLAGASGVNGYAGDGGPAAGAVFDVDNTPLIPNFGISLDPQAPDRLFVADTKNHCIRMIDLASDPPLISLYAGVPEQPGYLDGPADTALFDFPTNVYAHTDGAVYVSDTRNHVIRRIDASGNVTTVAGTGERGFNGDNLSATEARLDNPGGVVIHPDGRLFIADTGNNRVRVVLP